MGNSLSKQPQPASCFNLFKRGSNPYRPGPRPKSNTCLAIYAFTNDIEVDFEDEESRRLGLVRSTARWFWRNKLSISLFAITTGLFVLECCMILPPGTSWLVKSISISLSLWNKWITLNDLIVDPVMLELGPTVALAIDR